MSQPVSHISKFAWVCLPGLLLGPQLSSQAEECAWPAPSVAAPDVVDTQSEEFDLNADEALINNDQQIVVQGNVTLTHQGRTLLTDRLNYDREQGQLHAEGDVSYVTDDLTITSGKAKLDDRDGQGEFIFADVTLPAIPARASADKISTPKKNTVTLENAIYSGCPKDNNDWALNAKSITLHQEQGYGVGKHVWLRFFKVPLLYTPLISFPTNSARRSGFLTPAFANDERSGADIGLPFYWNIAPNYDLQLTPRSLSKRGFKLDSTFRYLTESHRGTLDTEYLPSDDRTNENRDFIRLAHRSRWNAAWSLESDITHLSDSDYLEDLGSSLIDTSPTHINRNLALHYRRPHLQAQLRWQDFLTLDRSLAINERPYERLPQLTINGRWALANTPLTYGFDNEWVKFDRSQSITGERLDVAPFVVLNWLRPGWNWTSNLTWHHTHYLLDDNAPQSTLKRTLPIFSSQAELNFERTLKTSGLTQTLTPRIQYTHIPFRDQSALPVFDSGQPDFNWTQLFNPYRFTGLDRIGDTDQLSLSVSTDILNPNTQRKRLSATLGQAFYLSEQAVNLPNDDSSTGNRSDILAEVRLPFAQNWQSTVSHRWDPETRSSTRSAVKLQFQRDANHLVNLAYRFRANEIEQTDLSFSWGLGHRWNLVGRWNYSLRDESTLERFAGLEYATCCWKARFIGRKFVTDSDGNTEDAFFAQLELNGLLSVGAKVDHFLERGILGYDKPQ